jgi:glycerophosphoryl diester phosphodiesterase
MIFTRKTSDALTSLVKKIDTQSNKKLNSFVVFLSDDEGLGDTLKDWAEKEGIKRTVITIDNVAGPKAYNVAKDAEVTVVLYNQRKVEANHAFKAGELNAKGIDAVIADLPKILPDSN